MTHSPARRNDLLFGAWAPRGYRAVFKLQSYAGFKEAGRATGRAVALTESDTSLKHPEASNERPARTL